MSASVIEQVTVYRRGARVRRAGPIHPGADVARLEGLPLSLDDGSVRVTVEGAGVRATDVRIGLSRAPDDPSLAPPRDEELRAAEDALTLARQEITRLETGIGRLDGLRVAPRPRPRRGERPHATPIEARVTLARLAATEDARLHAELASARAVERRAARLHAELEERARRASSARSPLPHELRKVAEVCLSGPAPDGARVVVEYVVPSATFCPAYSVWLEDGSARVAMRAAIAQRSGEDWRGVPLVLSTAEPDRFTELPELPRLRLGRAQPPRGAKHRPPPEGASALYRDYERALRPAPPPPPTDRAAPFPTRPSPLVVPEPPSPVRQAEALADDLLEMSPEPLELARMDAPARASVPFQPMPMPQAMSRKSGGLGGAVGGAIAGAVMAPAALLASALSKPAPKAAGHGERGRLETRAVELELLLVGYASLRLEGPDSPRRGELVATSLAADYAGGDASLEAAVSLALVAEGALAEPPPGHTVARAPDAFDYAYRADVPADVPSDGEFHVVPIGERRVPSRLRYVTVPREASDVFRVVALEAGDAALLEGPADVYEASGASYLLTARMPPTPPGGKAELGVGVEQAIKVARNVTFAEQKTGMLGGGLALVHDVAIELQNHLARPAAIEVRERVPVVRHGDDEIELDVGPVTPAWEEFRQDDTLRGGHLWRVDVDPGARRTLAARYTVKLSGKNQLAGGNRRES